jgi:hypothetical protein
VSAVLFNAGDAQRNYPDHCLVRHLLFRVGRGQRCLPDRERDLSAGGSGEGVAVFFAIAQCFGALGPVIYGALIGDGSQPFLLFLGYLLGAAVDGRGTRRLVPRGRSRRQVAEGATRPYRP